MEIFRAKLSDRSSLRQVSDNLLMKKHSCLYYHDRGADQRHKKNGRDMSDEDKEQAVELNIGLVSATRSGRLRPSEYRRGY